MNVAVHHAPQRQPTPQPSREHDLDEKLNEATAEINRLRALLADMPKPDAKEEPRSEPSGARRRHHRSPSTVTGTETEVSSYVDEPYQPEGASLPPKSLEMSVVSETSDDLSVPFSYWRPTTN